MDDNYQNLTKKERRELRRREREKVGIQIKRRKTLRKVLRWSLVVLGIGGGIFGIAKLVSQFSYDQVNFDITKKCVTHGRLRMHDHLYLTIFVNDEMQKIPANIGIVSAICFRPIHTHDDPGELHIEWETVRDFTLGEFFKVWDKPFNSGQILDYKVDEVHELTVTVNGVLNEEYENLILKDSDQIIIRYEEK